MITPISPISESFRLSHNGSNQNLVMAIQIEALGLKIKAPGVILEISESACKAADLAKKEIERKNVKPADHIVSGDLENPLRK